MKPKTKSQTRAITRLSVKAVNATERTFRGLAAAWSLDEGGDVIERGAFAKTLNDWKQSGGKRIIPLIDLHSYGSIFKVVGKMVDGVETEEGLETEWQVVSGDDGDKVLERVQGNYVNGLSIGYETVQAETEQITVDGVTEYIRHLKELKLIEVSLVIWGMNPDALIDTSSVKALLKAERAGDATLTAEQRTQLVEQVKEAVKDLTALLESTSPKEKTTEPVAATEEQIGSLRNRITALKLRSAATRLGRHAERSQSSHSTQSH